MKRAAKIKKKNEQIKEEKKIKRKIINEKDIYRVAFDVELSRADFAYIVNSLNWCKDSPTFRMMPRSYKSKHKKLLNLFEEQIDK